MAVTVACAPSEVVRLKVKNIDSAQKIIRVEQSKGRKDQKRHAIPGDTRSAAPMVGGAPIAERCRNARRQPLGISWHQAWQAMTTRQLSRMFHEAADAIGMTSIGRIAVAIRCLPMRLDSLAATS
jgi:integrase/recombinase XerD